MKMDFLKEGGEKENHNFLVAKKLLGSSEFVQSCISELSLVLIKSINGKEEFDLWCQSFHNGK